MAKAGWIRKITKAMELPPDALRPAPRIILSGNEEVLIGGHAVLLAYTPEFLSVLRGDLRVCVQGSGLVILAMDKLGICVGGVIDSISFER